MSIVSLLRAGFTDVQVIEEYDKGWISAIGKSPSPVADNEARGKSSTLLAARSARGSTSVGPTEASGGRHPHASTALPSGGTASVRRKNDRAFGKTH